MTENPKTEVDFLGPHKPRPTERARCYGCGRFAHWRWEYPNWIAVSSCQVPEWADPYGPPYWVCEVSVDG